MEFLYRAGQPPISIYKVAPATILHNRQYFGPSQMPSPNIQGAANTMWQWDSRRGVLGGGYLAALARRSTETACIHTGPLLIGVLADGHAAAVSSCSPFPGTASLAGRQEL